METITQLRDAVDAGRQAQIPVHRIDTAKIACEAGARIAAQPKKPLSVFQIQGKLDWIAEQHVLLLAVSKPAIECDDEIKNLNKQIGEVEKVVAWAKAQSNFEAESRDGAALTQKRLDKLRETVKDLTKRRDVDLKIAASIKARIDAYATTEQVAEWRDTVKRFAVLEDLNRTAVDSGGTYQSFR